MVQFADKSLLLANQIARITCGFKMDVLNNQIYYTLCHSITTSLYHIRAMERTKYATVLYCRSRSKFCVFSPSSGLVFLKTKFKLYRFFLLAIMSLLID